MCCLICEVQVNNDKVCAVKTHSTLSQQPDDCTSIQACVHTNAKVGESEGESCCHLPFRICSRGNRQPDKLSSSSTVFCTRYFPSTAETFAVTPQWLSTSLFMVVLEPSASANAVTAAQNLSGSGHWRLEQLNRGDPERSSVIGWPSESNACSAWRARQSTLLPHIRSSTGRPLAISALKMAIAAGPRSSTVCHDQSDHLNGEFSHSFSV